MKMKFLRFAFDTKLTNGLPFITMWEGNLAGMSFLVDSGSTDCVVYQRTVQ